MRTFLPTYRTVLYVIPGTVPVYALCKTEESIYIVFYLIKTSPGLPVRFGGIFYIKYYSK
jgi:hypothetical protein